MINLVSKKIVQLGYYFLIYFLEENKNKLSFLSKIVYEVYFLKCIVYIEEFLVCVVNIKFR